jgi:glycosyltransferase involved in cell wall biosynthesis
MNPEFTFSIIIPTYNRADFILRTVDTALKQRYRLFEVIIVDDGSTDNTEEIITSLESRLITYVKIPNSERGAARNKGVSIARGQYVTFLDSDDLLYPDYLSNAHESIVANGFPSFFHQAYEIRDEKLNTLYSRKVPKNDINFLIRGNDLSCLGIFIRRDFTDKFLFNTDRNLSGSEDWELWLRLAANFGLVSDSRISAALIVHDSRSVLHYDENKLVMRKNLAIEYAFRDPKVKEVFGLHQKEMEAYCDSYIALHLILSGQNQKGIQYLIHSLKLHPSVLLERRILAIFKYILLNVFGLRK